MVSSLIIVVSRGVKFTLDKTPLTHTGRLEPALSLLENNQPFLNPHSASSQWACHVGAQCTMQCKDASLIRVVTSTLLPSSCSPHPALTCLISPPEPGVWKSQRRDGLCHEWLTLCNLQLLWLVSTGV